MQHVQENRKFPSQLGLQVAALSQRGRENASGCFFKCMDPPPPLLLPVAS